MTTDHNTIHWVFAIIAFVILVAFMIGLLIGGLMHAAKRADNLGLIEPEDLMTDSERRSLAEKRDGMKPKIVARVQSQTKWCDRCCSYHSDKTPHSK